MSKVIDRLAHLEEHFKRLDERLADPELMADRLRFTEVVKERSSLEKLMEVYHAFQKGDQELRQARELASDVSCEEELRAMAAEEAAELEAQQKKLEHRLKLLLLPKDPLDDKDILVEIRAGAGGDEAGLFAGDVQRMYLRYAENQKWKTELLSSHEGSVGGFKEVVFAVKGQSVYRRMKYESGVHRVQRIPVTESGGRIHTSTITVAIMPEAEEVDIKIDPNDLRVDVFRSSGPGGQSVNTTDSAVRLTHEPSGIVISCQDEKSQIKNRAKAMTILRAKLYALEEERLASERSSKRKSQVGTGDRSERIRTYNFPQGRLTDHRIGLTLYRLGEILEGELDEVVEALIAADQEEMLESFESDLTYGTEGRSGS